MTSASLPLPKNLAEWEAARGRLDKDMRDKSLHDCETLHSGENITLEEFILYRTVCPDVKPRRQVSSRAHNLDVREARQELQQSANFQLYLTALRNGASMCEGAFHSAYSCQQEVLQGLQPGAQDHELTRIDVRPVRFGLIHWLMAVIGVAPAVKVQARATRIRLSADFGHNARIAVITDGQVQDIPSYKIRVIAKARHEAQPIKARMDEAATIVSWMKEWPDRNLRRLLVSQEDADIYITIPKFDDGWIRYIERGTQNGAGVMEMVKYGPWDIRLAEDMEELATIILALAHEA